MTDDYTKEIRERLEVIRSKSLTISALPVLAARQHYETDIVRLLAEREVLREALETLVIETNPANTMRLNQYPEVAEMLDSIFKGAEEVLAYVPEGVEGK